MYAPTLCASNPQRSSPSFSINVLFFSLLSPHFLLPPFSNLSLAPLCCDSVFFPPSLVFRGIRNPEGPSFEGFLEPPRSDCSQCPGRRCHHGEAAPYSLSPVPAAAWYQPCPPHPHGRSWSSIPTGDGRGTSMTLRRAPIASGTSPPPLPKSSANEQVGGPPGCIVPGVKPSLPAQPFPQDRSLSPWLARGRGKEGFWWAQGVV